MLISALNYAAYHIRSNLWNKGNMVAYLRSCAISKQVREHLWEVVKHNTRLEVIEEDGEIDDNG